MSRLIPLIVYSILSINLVACGGSSGDSGGDSNDGEISSNLSQVSVDAYSAQDEMGQTLESISASTQRFTVDISVGASNDEIESQLDFDRQYFTDYQAQTEHFAQSYQRLTIQLSELSKQIDNDVTKQASNPSEKRSSPSSKSASKNAAFANEIKLIHGRTTHEGQTLTVPEGEYDMMVFVKDKGPVYVPNVAISANEPTQVSGLNMVDKNNFTIYDLDGSHAQVSSRRISTVRADGESEVSEFDKFQSWVSSFVSGVAGGVTGTTLDISTINDCATIAAQNRRDFEASMPKNAQEFVKRYGGNPRAWQQEKLRVISNTIKQCGYNVIKSTGTNIVGSGAGKPTQVIIGANTDEGALATGELLLNTVAGIAAGEVVDIILKTSTSANQSDDTTDNDSSNGGTTGDDSGDHSNPSPGDDVTDGTVFTVRYDYLVSDQVDRVFANGEAISPDVLGLSGTNQSQLSLLFDVTEDNEEHLRVDDAHYKSLSRRYASGLSSDGATFSNTHIEVTHNGSLDPDYVNWGVYYTTHATASQDGMTFSYDIRIQENYKIPTNEQKANITATSRVYIDELTTQMQIIIDTSMAGIVN